MDYVERLVLAGFSVSEAKVYYALLSSGEMGVQALASQILMDRSQCYTVLNNLISKGHVHYMESQGKRLYGVVNVKSLLAPVEEKKAIVSDLVKDLKNISSSNKVNSFVKVLSGKKGLRVVMSLLSSQKKLVSFGGTGKAYDLFYESPRWLLDLKKKKVDYRLIVASKYSSHQLFSEKGLSVRFLDVDSSVTTTVTKDFVVIHHLLSEPFVIVIEDKLIAQSYLEHFEVLWKAASQRP